MTSAALVFLFKGLYLLLAISILFLALLISGNTHILQSLSNSIASFVRILSRKDGESIKVRISQGLEVTNKFAVPVVLLTTVLSIPTTNSAALVYQAFIRDNFLLVLILSELIICITIFGDKVAFTDFRGKTPTFVLGFIC
jgi:hypothetical protein